MKRSDTMANRRQKGTGSVWQDKSTKKWKGQIQIGYQANGNKKMKTVTGSSAKEVKTKLDKIKAGIITDTYFEKSNMTVPGIAHQINNEKKQLNIIKTGTYNRNEQTIKIIEKSSIRNIPIQQVTERQLRNFYLEKIDYSNSVLKKCYEVINASYRRAIQLDIVQSNININIPRPNSSKTTKKVKALTVEQQKKVVNALNTDNKEPYRTMLLLSLFTGMRMGEICALQKNCIDLKNNIITVERTTTRDENERFVIGKTPKTHAGIRNIKIIQFVSDMLKEYILNEYEYNEQKLIFTKNKKLITPNQTNAYYKRLITRYRISETADNFNQHQLRHTYATRSIESGMSAKVLQKKLGHTDIRVTMNVYADVFAKFEDAEDDKLSLYLSKEKLLK